MKLMSLSLASIFSLALSLTTAQAAELGPDGPFIKYEKPMSTDVCGKSGPCFGDFGSASYDLSSSRQIELWMNYRTIRESKSDRNSKLISVQISNGTVVVQGPVAERLLQLTRLERRPRHSKRKNHTRRSHMLKIQNRKIRRLALVPHQIRSLTELLRRQEKCSRLLAQALGLRASEPRLSDRMGPLRMQGV